MTATTVAILAGGRSRRMGAPKATLDLAGRALARRAVDAAVAAGLEAAVVTPPGVALPVLPRGVALWHEPAGEAHPARGLVAALEACGGPVVALACDLPLVPPPLLAWLATCEGTAVPSFGGVAQPLLARWDLSALPVLRAALEGGGSLRAAAVAAGANSIGEEELRRFGEPATFLAAVDTPADLARVERLLAGARRIDVE
ncbi:MAG TPA: NTP transferase domain-containing protein [Solirubrobacteraceae bacterium]|nr:NTP transferase domain-containing protein [Solirubrobacteraceae bacterium]